MNPAESQLLQNFLDQLTRAGKTTKDPEADALIARAVDKQPDAVYLLVQRTLLLEQALSNAKTQIAQLQTQPQGERPSGGGSFLDSGSAWGRPAVDSNRSSPPPPTALNTSPPSTSTPSVLGGGGGSFLGNIAATAAGVAGGAFLFEGIGSLLGHHSSGLGEMGAFPGASENVTVNNYYPGETSDRGDGGLSDPDDLDGDFSDDSMSI
jgi:hypothetical protein